MVFGGEQLRGGSGCPSPFDGTSGVEVSLIGGVVSSICALVERGYALF